MSKAHELARDYVAPRDGFGTPWKVIAAIDAALEWAAQQCEKVATDQEFDDEEESLCAEDCCAKRIRAGKSQ